MYACAARLSLTVRTHRCATACSLTTFTYNIPPLTRKAPRLEIYLHQVFAT